MAELQFLQTATDAAAFLGSAFISPCAIYSDPRWWHAIEKMRPEVDIRYLAVATTGYRRAVLPAYLYPSGRRGDRYSAEWGTIPGFWPAEQTDEPWAIVGSCSGLRTGFTYTGDWSQTEAVCTLLPLAVTYLQRLGFNIVMKYFEADLRDDIACALGLAPEVMPLADTHAVLQVKARDRDTYVASLPESFRGTVRRDMRRYRASGLQMEHTDLASVLSELPKIWDQVEVYHGAKSNIPLRESMLLAQCHALNDVSHVFRSRDASGNVAAISLNYRFRNTLSCRLVGIDYERSTPTGAYFETMYYTPLEWSIENGVTTIFLGTAAARAKVIRGASLEPMYALYLGVDGRTMNPLIATECTQTIRNELSLQLKDVSRKAFRRPAFLLP